MAHLRSLHLVRCERCGATGTMIRHGYNRGYVTPETTGIRGWRIRCKPERGGCKKTYALRTADSLLRRCISTALLWAFIEALLLSVSVKCAWERCGIRLSLDTGYGLYRRLLLCQPILRTRLCSRAPPPEQKKGAGSPLRQVVEHLRAAFGDGQVAISYQVALQKDILAIT